MHRAFSSLASLVCAVLCGLLLTPFRPSDASAAPPEPPTPTPKAAPVPAKANTSGIEYNRDIRPILAENCFACHGADSAARKGGLRIDRREDALEAKAVVPGKPTESEMIRRVLADAADKDLMPPVKSNKKLKPEQIALLKKWVGAGAEYQPHWSFIAPTRAALPAVKDKNWVRNPIDNFVLAELERRGLKPAPEAGRRTASIFLPIRARRLPG